MAGGIIYLDVDDEITSAAARIRAVDGPRVAVVLPYGSRLATSRINFRLLSRDALTHEKRLSIVAGDAASRALAASAGLPVFATVAEYEESLEDVTSGTGAGRVPTTTAAATTAAATTAAAAGRSPDPPEARDNLTSATVVGAAALAGAVSSGSATTGDPGVRPTTGRSPAVAPAPPVPAAPAPRPRTEPVARPGGRGGRRTPLLIGAAVVGLAAIVGGVGAYLLLPSATAVVTPREESMTPLRLEIEASTSITEPDVENGIVPAEVVTVNVDAAGTFPATGKRVEEEEATGSVRFSSLDPTGPNTIRQGSIVSTSSGIRFRTGRSVTLPAARIEGLTIRASTANVPVTAVEPGEEGNVEPNTITIVPRGEEPILLKVANPEATTGGAREEFPRVVQEDVDAAVAALTTQLQTAFDDQLDDPDLTGSASTVFPETATLGEPTWSVEPASLVGQEVATFDLGGAATGSVTAADSAPVTDIADEQLRASVEPGYVFVEGSAEITEDPAVVHGASITFPVTATGRQVAILDPAALEAAIIGRPVEEARTILEGYGPTDLDVWPDWVATIPTIDGRVEVIIDGPTGPTDPDENEPADSGAPGSDAP